ncbi:MAG: hypothetical protein F6K58_05380 [Symploca sp. SIO2E9]|nr:hypothetical protein [Symploca sp. SIO2E9]
MIFQPEFGNAFIDSPNIAISPEGLHSLLNTIEAELQSSEVYRRTMAGLENLLEEAFETGQLLVKAVGREAARLTLQELSTRYSFIPIISEELDNSDQENLDVPGIAENHTATIESNPRTNGSAKVSNSVEINYLPSSGSRTISEVKTKRKLAYQQADSRVTSEREMILLQIGQQLRQIRDNRSLSVQELHCQTLVPVHQIRALEAGNIEQLPEDVYLRGFICKLGKALGINGAELAASLPENAQETPVVTSWLQKTLALKLQLGSVHLYLGYTALIAGAIGGLSWLSNPRTQNNSVELNNSSYSSVSPQAEPGESISKSKPSLESSKSDLNAETDIATSEAMRFPLE